MSCCNQSCKQGRECPVRKARQASGDLRDTILYILQWLTLAATFTFLLAAISGLFTDHF